MLHFLCMNAIHSKWGFMLRLRTTPKFVFVFTAMVFFGFLYDADTGAEEEEEDGDKGDRPKPKNISGLPSVWPYYVNNRVPNGVTLRWS